MLQTRDGTSSSSKGLEDTAETQESKDKLEDAAS